MPILRDKAYLREIRAWIGDPALTFNLLYSASRDGCSGRAFHAKCNNQGPTVSIGHNSAGFIIGGYTSIAWTSRGNYCNDNRSFLFQLSPNMVKFSCKGEGNDVYDHRDYGPTFGGYLVYGQQAMYSDLKFFSNSCNKSGAYFHTNGFSMIGDKYEANGFNAQTFTGNNNEYVNIEVYAVKHGNPEDELYGRDKPWRRTDINDWSNETRDRLVARLVSFSTPSPAKVPAARLLLVGSVGAGKSSFFNTVRSVFKGEIRSQAATGTATSSLTTKYCVYAIRSGQQTPAFRLCDTMGLEEDQGLNVGDMSYLLDGHVPDQFQFNPAVHITRRSPGFVKDPGLADAVHCVALVIDGTTYTVMSPKIKDKLLGLRTLARDRDIPVHVVLTKVDKVCEDVAEDPSLLFHSRVIEKKVIEISDIFGIQSNHVQPVKNYESETSIDPRMDILTLNALRQMVRSAEDYIEVKLDDIEEEADIQMSKGLLPRIFGSFHLPRLW